MKYDEVLLTEANRIRNDRGLTWEQVANYMKEHYNVLATGNALRKACASYVSLKSRLEDVPESFFVPFVEEYDDFITLPYEDSIVISDVHLPFYNHILADKMLKVAIKFGIKRLFIIGDLFDAKSHSRFPTANNMSQVDAEYEIEAIRQFLITCARQFDDIYICLGNHELRVMNRLERKISFKTLLRMAISDAEMDETVIHVTEYPRILMKGKEKPDTWLGHPDTYSRIKGNVPRDLATKHLANIVTGHTHHLVLTSHISGQFYIMESGGLADPNKQEYKAMAFAPHPEWHPGFGMIKNERPFIFDEGLLTDWSFWLGNDENNL